MRQIITSIFFLAAIVCLVVVSFTYRQVEAERVRLEADLQNRSSLLADSFKETIQPYVIQGNAEYLQRLVERFDQRQRLEGIAIYDNKENVIAFSKSIPAAAFAKEQVVTNSMDENMVNSKYVKENDRSLFLFAMPLTDQDRVIGSMLLVQNASYIDDRLNSIWKTNLERMLIQIVLVGTVLVIVLNYLIYRPIKAITDSIKDTHSEDESGNDRYRGPFFLRPLYTEIRKVKDNLYHARISARTEARLRQEKEESPWTEERLKEYIRESLGNKTIIAVSNREPYIHQRKNGRNTFSVPASGMVTAIEPVMQACEGTWIAYGSGDGDRLVVDKHGYVGVPPDEPKYKLMRVWLTESEVEGYYRNFCNEGLWPLCHLAHTRPIFRLEDWQQYKKVNKIFADSAVRESKNSKRPFILIQDFHLALTPGLIKSHRPGSKIGIFWHIPWPNAEAFGICPYRKEILDGMLGADLIGFHTQQHCINFMDTVNRELESLVDYETNTVTRKGHQTVVKPFPISISFVAGGKQEKPPGKDEKLKILGKYGVKTKYNLLGVDRLDYTKGLIERLKAYELFLDQHSGFSEKITLIQISSPSRTKVKKYQEFTEAVKDEVSRINKKFSVNGWKPIAFFHKHHNHQQLDELYKSVDICLVTSLHDGMNLVAKEYIGARNDEQGVLILSKFAGASKQFNEAIIVNPYNIQAVADMIYRAIKMKPGEQKKAMHKLREKISRYNIYRWSYEYLKELAGVS